MSKNVQMIAGEPAVVGASRPTVGPASLVQGVYGARGNLELVACDAADGLWVFWLNADIAEDSPAAPEVPPGAWSTGRHFAADSRYTAACILQSALGPDHLEVVALDDSGRLQSWFWSPGPGFVRRAPDIADGVAAFAAREEPDGTLVVDCRLRGGPLARLAAGPDGYPERRWTAVTGAAQPEGGGRHAALAALAAAGIVGADAGTARSALSRRDGGTLEVTFRDAAGRLRHLGLPAEG